MPTLVELLKRHRWDANTPATPEALGNLAATFGALPADYRALLVEADGCTLRGFKTPLIVFSIREVLALHREHDLYTHVPQSLIFGGDGGGVLFAFDLRPGRGQRVFAVLEEDTRAAPDAWERLVFEGTTLTDLVERIVAGEKLNTVKS